MGIKLSITGKKALIDKLKKHVKAMDGGKHVNSAVVGYTQTYAMIVHEDLDARHKPGKSAKYLEIPARTYHAEIVKRIVSTTKATGSLVKGLLAAALFLQRKSQQIVPVDTGALKASAYSKVE